MREEGSNVKRHVGRNVGRARTARGVSACLLSKDMSLAAPSPVGLGRAGFMPSGLAGSADLPSLSLWSMGSLCSMTGLARRSALTNARWRSMMLARRAHRARRLLGSSIFKLPSPVVPECCRARPGAAWLLSCCSLSGTNDSSIPEAFP